MSFLKIKKKLCDAIYKFDILKILFKYKYFEKYRNK